MLLLQSLKSNQNAWQNDAAIRLYQNTNNTSKVVYKNGLAHLPPIAIFTETLSQNMNTKLKVIFHILFWDNALTVL